MTGVQPADRPDKRSVDFVMGEQAMPPFDSLKTRREFLAVARSGRRAVRPGLILQAGNKHDGAQGSAKTPPRIGFTVSKKVGNAVERNLVKRRFRALARLVMAQRADPARDYVLVGRKTAVKRPFGLLQKDLERALDELEGAPGQEEKK